MKLHHRWTGPVAVLHQRTEDGRVLLPSTAVGEWFNGPLSLCVRPGVEDTSVIANPVGRVLHVEVSGDELIGSGELDLEELRKHDAKLAELFERGEPVGVQAGLVNGEVSYRTGDRLVELHGPWELSYVLLGPPVWPQAMIRMVS